MQLLRALAALCLFLANLVQSDRVVTSLCGEQLTRQTGFLNGIYYTFYESSSSSAVASRRDIPVVLWLSGGPGCSGLVGAMFELGPCTFDDETDTLALNAYSWTNTAHVIFVDQPHGTGFSGAFTSGGQWTERQAMRDLAGFVDAFFVSNAQYRANDFFIFGESFGGHYVPDLAAQLLRTDKSWQARLRGVGIGNGVVSPLANLQTYLEFANDNKYASDLLDVFEPALRERQKKAVRLSEACRQAKAQSPPRKRMRAMALESDSDPDDDDSADGASSHSVWSPVCRDAAEAAVEFSSLAGAAITSAGHNMYDVRRACHTDDPLHLCYRLSRLQDLVNTPRALSYFGVTDRKWTMCSANVMQTIRGIDLEEESAATVAFLLEKGVRVIVYAGDADAVAPWNMQERWTRDLRWTGSRDFNRTATGALTVEGKQVGTVRTAKGLSLVRVFDSGHMVPHDQPQVALELLRLFTLQDGATKPPIFS